MQITLVKIAKRYGYEWIFRNIDFSIKTGERIAITGPNGSGKSTLVKIILGALDPSHGKVNYEVDNANVSAEDINDQFSFTGPYMDIIDNFTLDEMVKFHFSFRKPLEGISKKDIAAIALLDKSRKKEISKFSSGMQQRLKLTLALCSQSAAVVLDEPTTNLDEASKKWVEQMLETHLGNRTLIVATNEKRDADLCTRQLNIGDFK